MTEQRKKILERGSYFPGDWVRPRFNPGTWMAMVDVQEIFAGHRSITRDGRYEMYDGAVGVRLRVEEADKSEPFIRREKDWEQEGHLGPSNFWMEGGRMHMIYNVGENSCYALSDDGYHWERPVLKQKEFNGSTENNILGIPVPGHILEDPGAPPAERFKSISAAGFWLDRETGEEVDGDEADRCWRAEHYEGESYSGRKVVLKGAMEGHVSPDRFNWTKIEEPLGNYSVNGGLALYYDGHNQTYFSYIQPQGCAPVEPQSLGTGMPETEVVRRAVGLTRTKDFRHWPAAKLLVHPDAQDPLDISFYGACYFPYPGRQELHGMFLPVFHGVTDHVDMQLAFSRDGLVWTRPRAPPDSPSRSAGKRRRGPDPRLAPGSGGAARRQLGGTLRGALHPAHGAGKAPGRGLRAEGVDPESLGALAAPSPVRLGSRIGRALHHSHRVPAGEGAAPELPLRPGRLDQRRAAAPGSHDAVPGCQPLKGYSFEECDRLTGDEEDRVVTWRGNSDISAVGEMAAIRIRMFQAKLFAYRL